MTKVKYIRISSLDQNTARQEVNSKNFSKVYIDKCSGAIELSERKEGKKLIKHIEDGTINEVHVISICRLGRNLLDVLTTLQFFSDHKINLFVESIGMFSMIKGKQNSAFTMIISVLANVSEMEREFLIDRQKQGISIAKAAGTYKGRLSGTKMTEAETLGKYKKVVKELNKGASLRRAAALGECSLGTAQRVQLILGKY